jgi:hypothetical protein
LLYLLFFGVVIVSVEKINYSEWVSGVAFVCHGVRFNIRLNDRALINLVVNRLPPQCKQIAAKRNQRRYSIIVGAAGKQSGNQRVILLYVNSILLAQSAHSHEVLNALQNDLQLHIAQTSTQKIFIHAGVVGWKGQAILIPGYSFSGKSRLIAELIRAGAEYYSDEYALIDRRGRAHPYLKPLHIRDGESGKAVDCSVDTLGGVAETKALPVGLVLITRYKEGASWKPKQIQAGQSFLELIRHTASARSRPADTLSTLQKIVSQSPVIKTWRGEAKDVAKDLLYEIDRHSERSLEVIHGGI